MGLTVQQIQQRLARFEFEPLFVEDLGWQRMPVQAEGPALWQAHRGGAVIRVLGPDRWADGSFQSLCQLGLRGEEPGRDWLLIGLSADATRSLWCWSGETTESPIWHRRVVIRGQGDRAWAQRLMGLHYEGWAGTLPLARLLNRQVSPLTAAGYEGFQASWQTLSESLTAFPQAQDRRHYGLVLLSRLMAAAVLQKRGYLGGDEWYLHNQFGQSQQRGRDRFFLDFFQPLCQQGFALPSEERSAATTAVFGDVPFLPTGPFAPQRLDYRWGARAIADAAFEPALEWIGDLLMHPGGDVTAGLPEIFEQAVNSRGGSALVTPTPVLEVLGDRTVNATVLDYATEVTGQTYGSVEKLLMEISAVQAVGVLQRLASLTLLDPACGSGRYLLMALQQLMYVVQSLGAVAGAAGQATVPDWVRGSPREDGLGLKVYRHLVSHCLYGVELWPPALELARLQLFLAGVQSTPQAQDLASLPDLTLTLLPGNALIGLVSVDPERFDRVAPRGRRPPPEGAQVEAAAFQGNLLQPLMANTYQAILAERQVRLEHYRSQTQLLAETGSVPAYAQADFLRDRLEELNQTAQTKLTHLLWSEASQQLGIRVQSQDLEGRRHSRPLTLADVEAVAPFHWGFTLHPLLRNRGGVDIVLSHFPGGVVQPTEAGFLEAYQDTFQIKRVEPSTFLHNHRQVLTIDPDLALAWAHYRGQQAWPSQYFRHGGQYPQTGSAHPNQGPSRLYWSRLFLERSLQLLRPGGRCGVMLDPFWAMANSAPLRHWLVATTAIGGVVDIANYRGLWPTLSPRTTVCLVWLKKQGQTLGCPYSAYSRATQARQPTPLGAFLQRLIHLAE